MSFKETFEMIKDVAPKCSDNYAVLGSALLVLSERIGGNTGIVDPGTAIYGPTEVEAFETPEEIKAFKDRMVEKVKTEMEKVEKTEEVEDLNKRLVDLMNENCGSDDDYGGDDDVEYVLEEKPEKVEEKVEEKPQVTEAELRALMLAGVQKGTKKQIFAILAEYDAKKLPEVDPVKYNELAEKVRAL